MLQKLGPGLLFAASAVGVSHLVQSTRAGATFGLTMAILILLFCAFKYPAFRFGAEYAAATGESLVDAYARRGRSLLAFFLVALAAEGLVAVPAVSLVAAGLSLNLLGGQASEATVTMGIVIGLSVALALGRYPLLERISRVFVVVFALLTLVATIASLRLLPAAQTLAVVPPLTGETVDFSVAVAGWMPVGMGASVFMSLWVLARAEARGVRPTVEEARFDFDLGYVVTVILALCFLLMGTLLMLGTGAELAGGSTAFAAGLIQLFGDVLGEWIRPIIEVAALAVMFSTVIAVLDGFPRVYADVTRRLLGLDDRRVARQLYLGFLAFQAVVALVLLTLLLSSFGVFIDLATTAGFVVAPAIAFLNHRVIHSEAMPAAYRPSPLLSTASFVGVIALTGASLGYLYFRFL